MLKKVLSIFLIVLIIFVSITCGFCFSASAEDFSDCTEYIGASIRRNAGGTPQAIRFRFEISNSVTDVYADKGYELLEYGALVAYDTSLRDSELILNDDMTVNGYEVVKGVAFNKEKGINRIYETREESVVVSFALYNLGVYENLVDYSAYNRAYAVRPYAIYTDADSNEYVFYDDIEKAALFDVTDAVLSESTADEIISNYSFDSLEYAEYLSDVVNVRILLSEGEVKSAYDKSGRTVFKNNENAFCTIMLHDLEEEIDIHTELQANYLTDAYDKVANYADGTKELSRPLSIDLKWNVAGEGDGIFYGYLFTLSEREDLSYGKSYCLKSTSLKLSNLKIGTDYYWNVAAVYNDGVYLSATDKFSISGTTPRNIHIEGVTNVRDLGGFLIDGKRTNQGLIFRAGRLDAITPEGEVTLLKELGIKSEIDIRFGYESTNILGDKLKYYNFYMSFIDDVLALNADSIVKFFEVLGDESNYPVIFHCSIGTDRTGMLAFMLNGLLGASEEQLYEDYLFSNFADIGASRDGRSINAYIGTMNLYEGDTLSKRIYNYLLSIGVKAEHMDNFIRIMTE